MVTKAMEQLGYKKAIFKSNDEPAILALKDAVRSESEVELVLEESPVGDRQANGLVENAVKNVQGQFRVIKDALGSRYNRRLGGGHPAAPRLAMQAASVINRGRKDGEGLTPHKRWEGKELTRPITKFGERLWHTPANSAGEGTFDDR